MDQPVQRLYPTPAQEEPLHGLYLRQEVRQQEPFGKGPFIYANFVTSLDGRIAVPDNEGGVTLAEAVTNPRDWRLFQELAVQADLLITSGRYLREYAQGASQEILQVYDDPRFADLEAWRQGQNLPPQPDLAVLSRSLDFEVPPTLAEEGRALLVFTTQDADPAQVRRLKKESAQVIVAGDEGVEGQSLAQAANRLGYGLIYSTAGPKVLHLLLSSGVLSRLYLTFANRILGGRPFSSIVEGPALPTPANFNLHSLYWDAYGLDGLGQLFATYDHVPGA